MKNYSMNNKNIFNVNSNKNYFYKLNKNLNENQNNKKITNNNENEKKNKNNSIVKNKLISNIKHIKNKGILSTSEHNNIDVIIDSDSDFNSLTFDSKNNNKKKATNLLIKKLELSTPEKSNKKNSSTQKTKTISTTKII